MIMEELDMGKNVKLLDSGEGCSVFGVEDETGNGRMTMYSVFDGVYVMYNDFHMAHCFSYFQPDREMLCIDHCREGRIEWQTKDGRFIYIEASDMQLNSRHYHCCDFCFPLSHYHGVTVGFDLNIAEKALPHIIDGFDVDIRKICRKFCSDNDTFLMRADRRIEHIFSELYDLPDDIRLNYFKIKVLELLLFLGSEKLQPECEKRPYYTRTQVEKIKAIAKLITDDPEKRYTLEELSEKFDISLTSMKECFKGVYGTSIYAYAKSYRMNMAAVMLKNTDKSVLEIAGLSGYENAGKFSSAFRAAFGMTPLQYRKNPVRMD
ncbi:MAG: helix-turn-helix domain-containing protein [Oscillospiraceae bacterium]